MNLGIIFMLHSLAPSLCSEGAQIMFSKESNFCNCVLYKWLSFAVHIYYSFFMVYCETLFGFCSWNYDICSFLNPNYIYTSFPWVNKHTHTNKTTIISHTQCNALMQQCKGVVLGMTWQSYHLYTDTYMRRSFETIKSS